MGEAPESGGEIEGHRESLRGRHALYIKGSENAGVSGPAKPRNRREAESFAADLLKDKTDGQDV
jgi:hypothetical protein